MTEKYSPDMLEKADLTAQDKKILEKHGILKNE